MKQSFESGYPDYMRDGLILHNTYRQKHGVANLQLNEDLCSSAQEWADNCAKNGRLGSLESTVYGENIFMANYAITLGDVIKKWYDDGRSGYQYKTENPKKKNYSFTQMVWKGTTDLGFGMSTSAKGRVFIVALYSPKGNIRGQFVENVPDRLPDLVAETPSLHLRTFINGVGSK